MKVDEQDDACCTTESGPQPGACPTCGIRGKSVPKLTISVMAKDPKVYLHSDNLPDGKYYMCETRTCPTVYYNLQGDSRFNKDEIRVRVWQKELDSDVPACYCFHNTIFSISEELRRTGTTDVLSRISAQVKAGNCRCEVTNPQGSCCLGNVAKAVKIAKQNLQLDTESRSRIAVSS